MTWEELEPLPETDIMWWWRLRNIEMRIRCGDYNRASGDCICSICNRLYYDHPLYKPGLTLLCDGTLVHL